jgi:hypothetical protein
MITCWSVKGGSGTSVVAALLAIAFARIERTVLVDADGDQPAIFGVSTPSAGFRDWWQSGVEIDALQRLAIDISSSLRLIPSGTVAPTAQRDFVGVDDAQTIVDAGVVREVGFGSQLVENSAKSFLILRPCYLAARRASMSSLRIDGMIVVEEQGRTLRPKDLAEVVGAPVVATLPWDLSLARVIDAGRLANRVPRSAKVLEDLAKELVRVC